jgi:NAD(P)-dependent dehydrogenase (short-subunit alcohol dehydrogenase family)
MWDIKSKKILLTGGTSGIGEVAAIELATRGANVVIACRNMEKGNEVVKKFNRTLTRKGSISLLKCNLSSLRSVKSACLEYKNKFKTLDVLINNAGIWNFKHKTNLEGIEETFAVNFLAPYLMTTELLNILNPLESRIIFTASALHQGKINFEDIEFKNAYSGVKAYRQSKLAIILLAHFLAKKLSGTGITVNCNHPGLVSTGIGREAGLFSNLLFKLLGKSPQKGADTLLYLVTSDEVSKITGEYFADRKITKTTSESYNTDSATKLYELAATYVKNI